MPGVLETIALVVSSLATTVAAANALYLGTYALALGGLAFGAQALQGLFVQKPSVPKPDDGSYNLKQSVPSLAYVLGTTKKGGDYVFLEETGGTAHHIIVWAGHRISSFVQHYLHDEKVTLNGSGAVTSPGHFGGNVVIESRLGLNAETVYSLVVTRFPTIWNNNCRGDGLASVYMRCGTVDTEDFLDVYPNQMPEHSAVGNGALLYDPRKDSTQGGSGSHRYTNPNTWEFSKNIPLMRLWHLCHPVGGKMSYENMYLPDWQNAANVADQNVTNRTGGTEKRWHGGFWFRASNDPIEVGRVMDEAAEMVVFERADGKIGVHAGEYVAPDITLEAKAIYSIRVDKNKRRANTVLGVRGRYVNTAKDYITEDAAIYGDPYSVVDDETERTKTFENALIQSHNHCQRKQKLTYIRANARKVSIVADYTAGSDAEGYVRDVPYRRFVTVHYPSRGLVNATVEITSSVSIDLRNMRISFSGILVDSTLYDFNAATEEGEPGEAVEPLPDEGVPDPVDFSATIQTEVVSGGSTAAFILGTFDFVADTLIYELEYDRTSGSTGVQSVFSKAGETQVRTGYLVDGEEYKCRLRAYGGGSKSDWTSYINLTATADPVPPGPVTGVSADVSTPGEVEFGWTAPNSANYYACRIYVGTINDINSATLMATEYGPPSATDLRVVTSLDAGPYYGWLRSINPSGVPGTAVATGLFTVT
ncbi:hypothetical protein CWR43_28185 [Rhizobium sullae]|uniref:Fibronectin type-III domain-containing protein n=1 Tax=Rhizobium sullae TaxID=50338 RepID=A0A2N0D319_RHISU|nr:hypothetical protein [Rhizobium sullae]PKA40457.1 hypothetical protein CWR43_28185 [Rhizobium sullae]